MPINEKIRSAFWMFTVTALLYSNIGFNDAQGAGDALQKQLDEINERLDNISILLASNVSALDKRITQAQMAATMAKTAADAAAKSADAAATAAAEAQMTIDDELKPELANVTKTVTKLVNINKTWKANFKVVNSTLMILRRKLSFRAPHIPIS